MIHNKVIFLFRKDLKVGSKDIKIENIQTSDFCNLSLLKTHEASVIIFIDSADCIKLLKSRYTSRGIYKKEL